MPVLVDDDADLVYPKGWADNQSDPYGFGLPYRDHISRFVEVHREKIHRGARRCPLNSLIVRPLGAKEHQENPAAKAAMDKSGIDFETWRSGTRLTSENGNKWPPKQ